MTTVGVHQLLNTLYITTERAYLHVDHETLRVEEDGATRLQIPVHHLGAVVCFGNVMVSPAAIQQCAREGRALVFLDRNGRFQARVVGATTGNVLLRQAQHRALENPQACLDIARAMVAGKAQNARQVLMRGAREAATPAAEAALRGAAAQHAAIIEHLGDAGDMDTLRGREGEAAHAYFGVFDELLREPAEGFRFDGRNRRPPRDPVNAVLSFLYTLLRTDCVAALEGVGLDPQVGYLHALRPGRPALALDIMEELRAAIADRLALTLINRRQLTLEHFEERPGGAVSLTADGRRLVIVAYQKRKQEEVRHPVLESQAPIGLLPHVQARLVARHLRGDLEHYLPILIR